MIPSKKNMSTGAGTKNEGKKSIDKPKDYPRNNSIFLLDLDKGKHRQEFKVWFGFLKHFMRI